jgi:hypothetical protein
MPHILQSERTTGVPPKVQIPDAFRCPVCDKGKTKGLPVQPTMDTFLLPIGARFHADFGFYKIPSICGFTCFLLLTEAQTGYEWIYICHSKHSPCQLFEWIVSFLRKHLGVAFAVLRTDGGGELGGCHDLRSKLLK